MPHLGLRGTHSRSCVSTSLVPLPRTQDGFKYLLTVKDLFTKYLEASFLQGITSVEVMDTLYCEVFARYGLPIEFVSLKFREALKELGVRATTKPAYMTIGNCVERSHRDLN